MNAKTTPFEDSLIRPAAENLCHEFVLRRAYRSSIRLSQDQDQDYVSNCASAAFSSSDSCLSSIERLWRAASGERRTDDLLAIAMRSRNLRDVRRGAWECSPLRRGCIPRFPNLRLRRPHPQYYLPSTSRASIQSQERHACENPSRAKRHCHPPLHFAHGRGKRIFTLRLCLGWMGHRQPCLGGWCAQGSRIDVAGWNTTRYTAVMYGPWAADRGLPTDLGTAGLMKRGNPDMHPFDVSAIKMAASSYGMLVRCDYSATGICMSCVEQTRAVRNEPFTFISEKFCARARTFRRMQREAHKVRFGVQKLAELCCNWEKRLRPMATKRKVG